MTPTHAVKVLGRRRAWVAKQMGISLSYLSKLLAGERRWTPELERSFAAALGISHSALSFPQSVAPESS